MALIDQQQALEFLRDGAVVALPTETVYGLAGRIDQDQALERIFKTKQRPFFDPLIVHVKDLQQAEAWAQFDEASRHLATSFWPGPLTLVLPKKDGISRLINNGGTTVALRSPDHLVFQQLLEQLKVPLAAPSANMFGKTSPTTAQHVLQEFAGNVPVVDGGACHRGIESTVVQVDLNNQVLRILRPGVIDADQLRDFFANQNIKLKVTEAQSEQAPGHLKNHYQPNQPVALVDSLQPLDQQGLQRLTEKTSGPWQELLVDANPTVAARHLYGHFREFSDLNKPLWIRVQPHWKTEPAWQGFYDRIQKAASYRLVYENGHWRVLSET